MLNIIGLGLCDEKDITVRGLEVRLHQPYHRRLP
jgi:diphthamide biosynthesis methyltransferase